MHRHAVIHLPPLSSEEASRLLVYLERASSAIWRAHGAEVLDFRLRFEGDHRHPFDDDDIPCFCPRHPERDHGDAGSAHPIVTDTPLSLTLLSLSTEQAIALCDLLQKVVEAIWDVHGDAMVEVYAREAQQPEPTDWPDPGGDLDDDVPF